MTCTSQQRQFRILSGINGWAEPSDEDVCHLDGLHDDEGLRLSRDLEWSDLDTHFPPPWLAEGGPCSWYMAGNRDRAFVCQVTPICPDDVAAPCPDLLAGLGGSDAVVTAISVAADRRRIGLLGIDGSGCPGVWVWTRSDGRLVIRLHRVAGRAIAFAPWGDLLLANDDPGTITRFDRVGKKKGTINFSEVIDRKWRTWQVRFRHGRDWIEADQETGHDVDWLNRSPSSADDHAFESGAECAMWVAVTGQPASEPPDGGERHRQPVHLYRLTRQSLTDGCGCDVMVTGKSLAGMSPRQLDVFLETTFRPTALSAWTETGFCLAHQDTHGDQWECCYRRDGSVADRASAIPAGPVPPPRLGQLLTGPIDSYLQRCRWHRVHLDAEIPVGTSLEVAVSSSEELLPPTVEMGGPPSAESWEDFPRGRPRPEHWQTVEPNTTDFLISEPPGRYLYVRIRLMGRGRITPVVRRVVLDFPRMTSLEQLPGVYRDNPVAEDFTERFLSLFDQSISNLDMVIEEFPRLLDVGRAGDEVLAWLAGFFDVDFYSGWTPKQRRDVLRSIQQLYRGRGTAEGLRLAVQLIFDVTPVIVESVRQQQLGVVDSSARLGETILPGPSRMRLGTTQLGSVPLRSHGDPDLDPLAEGAHRFQIMMPASAELKRLGQAHLERMIELQKPAHTGHTLRVGGEGFVIGLRSNVGVDTKFVATAPPVLGGLIGDAFHPGTARLNDHRLLRSVDPPHCNGLQVGLSSKVGINTIVRE